MAEPRVTRTKTIVVRLSEDERFRVKRMVVDTVAYRGTKYLYCSGWVSDDVRKSERIKVTSAPQQVLAVLLQEVWK